MGTFESGLTVNIYMIYTYTNIVVRLDFLYLFILYIMVYQLSVTANKALFVMNCGIRLL